MAVFGLYLLKLNFHTVVPGEVYRSAQLTPSTLKKMIQKYKIRSVINLRGKNTGQDWYQDELEAASESGARHFDVDLTSTSLPRNDELRKLYRLLNQSSRPVLVHCKSGADRSGLASAMALLMKEDANLEDIQNQSSWRYLAFSPDTAGKLFLQEYRQWLNASDQPHDQDLFTKWVEKEYVDSSGNFYFLVDPIDGQAWKRPNGGYEEGLIFNVNRSGSSELHLSGWAFDTLNESPLQEIAVYFDDIPLNPASYGIFLPHLMHDFGKENYLHSGWELKHPLATLEDGCYDLTLHLTGPDKRKWISSPQARVCIQ